MRISDWSSDVCSSDLGHRAFERQSARLEERVEPHHAESDRTLARGRICSARHAGLGTVDIILEHVRSEEHTSELQSLMRISYAVFCLKKQNTHKPNSD